ncbi:MAG: gamma-glutamyl-gamma-aminobutyrate hydrolase family protein [Woeseiaceae bacterium]|nr:gamma-glutamyl-gamma-aminobutyrate hydrolase family protein [Woeseiaceae bacterium]
MDIKPVIGVPACRRLYDGHPFHMVGEKYLRAVTDAADAVPLGVPALADEVGIEALLGHVDGILLTGSMSNVEPRHYAGDAAKPGTLHDPQRDAMTLPLARRAIEAGVPLFAICRGIQELNVALGGTLHQHVYEVEPYHVHHENPDDPLDVQYGPSHPVNIVEGGFLHGLLGESTIMVNSLHKQGIRKLADGTTVEAVADDGLIEAFSVDDTPTFAFAVQWHPEWRATENEVSMKIFKAFGDACRERAAGRKV